MLCDNTTHVPQIHHEADCQITSTVFDASYRWQWFLHIQSSVRYKSAILTREVYYCIEVERVRVNRTTKREN